MVKRFFESYEKKAVQEIEIMYTKQVNENVKLKSQ